MTNKTVSDAGDTSLTEAESAVERLMDAQPDRPWTMTELGAKLAEASVDTPVSIRRLAIQRLLSAGRLVMGDDRVLTLAHHGWHSEGP
jgi:hypothetical protein